MIDASRGPPLQKCQLRGITPERIDQAPFGCGRLPAQSNGFGVFAQIGEMLRFNALAAGQGDHRPRFTYRITLQPGESRSLLSFTLIGAPQDAAQIATRAAAIAANPNAAAPGLSPDERARVLNFTLVP